MNTDEFQDAPVPAADEPVGTPPAGGSWVWANGAWVRGDVHQMLPDDQPAQE
jgi:hypothetical protein